MCAICPACCGRRRARRQRHAGHSRAACRVSRAWRDGAHIEATLIERLGAIALARAGAPGQEAARRRAHRFVARRRCSTRQRRGEGRGRRDHASLSILPAPRSTRRSRQPGVMPLPPYIAGKRAADARDADDYQTLFAREAGRRRRADGGSAFHAGSCSQRLEAARRRAASRDAACRRRHLSCR